MRGRAMRVQCDQRVPLEATAPPRRSTPTLPRTSRQARLRLVIWAGPSLLLVLLLAAHAAAQEPTEPSPPPPPSPQTPPPSICDLPCSCYDPVSPYLDPIFTPVMSQMTLSEACYNIGPDRAPVFGVACLLSANPQCAAGFCQEAGYQFWSPAYTWRPGCYHWHGGTDSTGTLGATPVFVGPICNVGNICLPPSAPPPQYPYPPSPPPHPPLGFRASTSVAIAQAGTSGLTAASYAYAR